MSKRKPQEQASKESSDWFARGLGVLAIGVSLVNWWLNYASSLPAIQPKVELVEPLAAGKDIHFKILLDNNGRTTAKYLRPNIAFKLLRTDASFEPTYDAPAPAEWKATVSDLAPGIHGTILSTNRISLAHQHDVEAVLEGKWNLYIYGKIPYEDIFHLSHEIHFCGYYRQFAGMDPLKFNLCQSYNETQ